MAIANGTCASFFKSAYKAQFGYFRSHTRFAGGGIWLLQESLRHILAYPLGTPLGQ